MYNYFKDNNEYDECTARGTCSIPPSISAVQETLLVIIRQCAFYISKLKSLEKSTKQEEISLINMFSYAISYTSYNDTQIIGMIKSAYQKLHLLRKNYQEKCKVLNLPKSDLKDKIIINEDTKLSQIIGLGEKYFQIRCKQEPKEKKNLADLLIMIIKNTADNLLSVYEYNAEDNNITDVIINSLNLLNKQKVTLSAIEEYIDILIEQNMSLVERLYRLQKERYGEIQKTEVNLSTRSGNCILVSGSNLNDLNSLLEFTENEDIDIYTHDNLIIAHGFEKLKKYKNLHGQFGNCKDNCVLDFAVFPGAVLITRNSNINTEYLYRGRIFTTSGITPQGVISIRNNDYTKLIKSAKEAKGFAKGQEKTNEIIGFNQKDIEYIFENLKEKINNGKIKNIIILDCSGYKNQYFIDLLKNLKQTNFIISFSYLIEKQNAITINCGNNQPLIWKVMTTLNKYIPLNDDRINYLFSKCDSRTISNMIHLNKIGAKKIYLTNCSPNSINPSLKSYITNYYGIKNTTTPDKDFKKINE